MKKDFLGTPRTHIMVAIDTETKAEAFQILDKLGDAIDVIKVGSSLVFSESISVITEIKQRYGLPIVADLKVADAPVTNNKIVRQVRKAGGDAVMVHGFIGANGLDEVCNEAAGELGIIVVTELTHPGGLEFTRHHAEDFAKMANLLDCYGIQAPGNRPDRVTALKDIAGLDKVVVCCGIGAQGGNLADAIRAGGTYGIIGRAIISTPDPREAALQLAKSVA